METLEKPASNVVAQPLADSDITAAIGFFFLTKKGMASNMIDVTTADGIVELAGLIDSLLLRQRAEEIALAVRGVRGVINELVICTDDVPGHRLHLDAERALADDPATGNYNLHSRIADGVVALVGTVQSWAERQLALRVLPVAHSTAAWW